MGQESDRHRYFIAEGRPEVTAANTRIIVAKKATDAHFNKLYHELQTGRYDLSAFSDWVDLQGASAQYQAERVRYQAERVIFQSGEEGGLVGPVNYNPVREARLRLNKVKRQIRSNSSLGYHLSIDALDKRYAWSMYAAQKYTLELTTPADQRADGKVGELQLQSRALSDVARRLTTLRNRLVQPPMVA